MTPAGSTHHYLDPPHKPAASTFPTAMTRPWHARNASMPRPQGFNFCNGAPLTGGERLELCYFPAHGGGRSVEGPGDSDSTSPCLEGNFVRVRRHSQTRRLLVSLSSPHHIVAAVPPQDPHLSFPFGGTADFRGRDGQCYCFLSAPRLAINIKTEDTTFRLHNLYDKGGTLVVDGSFITEAQRAEPGRTSRDAP